QRHIERADPTANRRRQRPLDPDTKLAKRIERLIRQPVARLIKRSLSRQHFLPSNLALPAISLRNSRIQNLLASAPNIGAGTIPFNERNNRPIRNRQPTILHLNRITHARISCFAACCSLFVPASRSGALHGTDKEIRRRGDKETDAPTVSPC